MNESRDTITNCFHYPAQYELMTTEYLTPYMDYVDLSHALALRRAGLIKEQIFNDLISAIIKLMKTPPQQIPISPDVGDLYKNREAALFKLAPRAAGYLALGRARREVTTTAFHMAMRSQLCLLQERMVKLIDSLMDLAQAHKSSLMPDHTYLQPAQPTTFGHYIFSFVYPLLRSSEALGPSFQHINECPAGVGSVNGTALHLDRKWIAELLGFEEPVMHARDAIWQPDIWIRLVGILVGCSVTLSRLADDYHIWCTPEFDYIQLPTESTRKSVIMPQKRNPYALSFVRGCSSLILGKQVAIASANKTPSLQIDNRIVAYSEMPQAIQLVHDSCEIMDEINRGLVVNEEQMKKQSRQDFTQATDLVELLAQKTDLDHRSLSLLVAEVITELKGQSLFTFEAEPTRQCLLKHAKTKGMTRISAALEDLEKYLDPEHLTNARKDIGGTSPQSFKAMIADIQTKSSLINNEWNTRKSKIENALEQLVLLATSNPGRS